MTKYQISRKLIGNIEPCGRSEEDEERLKNLVEQCNLIENLLGDIVRIKEYNQHSQEHSVKLMTDYCGMFLKEIGL